MPELPEVETIVRDLRARLVGHVVRGVHIEWAGSIAQCDPVDFAANIAGKAIEEVERRGKNILIGLSGGEVLLVHLRMTGRLILAAQDEATLPYTRAVIHLDRGLELRFADLRKFGRMRLLPAATLHEQLDKKLGPEPLHEALTPAAFSAMVKTHRGQIKSLLLDQRFLAGIGNIYADEALFEAGIHPHRAASGLTEDESNSLHAALQRVLNNAIGNRGTSFSDYLDARGQPGGHREHLMVYRRTGLPCLRCGRAIERLRFGGRGSHFCPDCQPAQ